MLRDNVEMNVKSFDLAVLLFQNSQVVLYHIMLFMDIVVLQGNRIYFSAS